MVDSCNATVQVQKAFYSLTDNLEGLPALLEIAVQCNGLKSNLTLPVQQYHAKGLQSKCPLLRFRDRKARAAFDDTLLDDLSSALMNNTVQKGYYFDKGGAKVLPDGRICFLRGAELLGGQNLPYMTTPEISGIRLLGDGASPSRLIPMLLSAPPQVLLVFAYVILASIRSLLIDNKIDLQAVLYIVGKQGLGKTTLATRIAGIYEKGGQPVGIIQAGSTPAAANTLMTALRDQPVIIDDLCLSASRNTARKRVELASQLIRQGTGYIPIMKNAGKSTTELPCEAALIMTAEFHLENLSDLTRCMIVPVQKPLNISDGLTPDLIGDAVRHYSRWLPEYIQEEIHQFREAVDIATAKQDEDTRMATNYACLKTAFQSFLHSLSEPDACSSAKNHALKRMDMALNEALAQHQRMIGQIKERYPVGNLSFCILEGYKNDAFDLAKKIEKLNKHDGIIWKGDLCLRKEALVHFIRQQPGYHDWTANRIIRSLKDSNALILQEENAATVHLDKGSNVPRVYRIRLDVLKDTAESY